MEPADETGWKREVDACRRVEDGRDLQTGRGTGASRVAQMHDGAVETGRRDHAIAG